MYTTSVQAKPSDKPLLTVSLANRCPTSQAAWTQVGQPGRCDAGRPSVGLSYYLGYPSLRLGRSQAFETMLQDIPVIWPPAK